MREQQVVRRSRRGGWIVQAWCVLAGAVTVAGHDLRLVQRDPVLDPVAERVGDDSGVVREALGRVPHCPAALVLDFLRQIPVVERCGARDALAGEFVEQPLVIVEAFLVGLPAAAGQDARPRDGEPVAVEP